jgi:hypothetical protein
LCASGGRKHSTEEQRDRRQQQGNYAGATRAFEDDVEHGGVWSELGGLVVDIVDRGIAIGRHLHRHAPGIPERVSQQEFDLAIQTAQVIVGPPLDGVEHIAVYANEE